MRSIFIPKRFWWLLVYHLNENRRTYLFSLGVVSLFLIYFAIIQERGHIIAGVYPFALCCAGCLITANSFQKWSDFGHASNFLLTPASLFEKYLVAIVVGVVLFVPLFTIFYFLAGYLFLNIFHPPVSLIDIIPGMHRINTGPAVNRLDLLYSGFLKETLFTYLLLQPFFLVIATRFRKYQFFIGSLFIVAIFTANMFLSHQILIRFAHQLAYSYTYFSVSGPVGCWDINLAKGSSELVNLSLKPWVYQANTTVYLLLAGGLYLAAWFSLKERKI